MSGRRLYVPEATVLVISPAAMVRASIRQTLEYYGHTVLEAGSGREGVRTFIEQQRVVTLAILDTALTDVPATKVLAALRTLQPEIRVAVCTDQSVTEAKADSSLQGVEAVLRKPIGTDSLLAAVRRSQDPR